MTRSDKPIEAAGVPFDQIAFREATTIDPSWTSVAAVALGGGSLDHYLLVEADGVPRLRLELRGSGRPEAWSHVGAIVWAGRLVIGFAQRVYLVSPRETESGCVELESYFEDLRAEGDRLLVTSGEDITCLDQCGTVLWRSAPLGLDGIIIHAIDDGVISGDGEWDPPGGWRPFAISLVDGTPVGSRREASEP